MVIIVFCLSLLYIFQFVYSRKENQLDIQSKNERKAIVAFRKSIKVTEYRRNNSTSGSGIFYRYSDKLHKAFLKHHVSINLLVVGSCDFKGSAGVEKLAKVNSNWNGILVEPVPVNYEDLNKLLKEQKIDHRMKTLHGAVVDTCDKSTVQFAFPIGYEKYTPNAAHWLRREIGFVYHVNAHKKVKDDPLKDKKNWKLIDVPCYTGPQVLRKWRIQMQLTQKKQGSSSNIVSNLHVLMIDTEGSDANILTSIINALPTSQLPLLILFEWKLLSTKEQEDIIILLQSRGYAVGESHRQKQNDMFALLKPPKMRQQELRNNKNKNIGETVEA